MTWRPALSRGVVLRHDRVRGTDLLLLPERVVVLRGSAGPSLLGQAPSSGDADRTATYIPAAPPVKNAVIATTPNAERLD